MRRQGAAAHVVRPAIGTSCTKDRPAHGSRGTTPSIDRQIRSCSVVKGRQCSIRSLKKPSHCRCGWRRGMPPGPSTGTHRKGQDRNDITSAFEGLASFKFHLWQLNLHHTQHPSKQNVRAETSPVVVPCERTECHSNMKKPISQRDAGLKSTYQLPSIGPFGNGQSAKLGPYPRVLSMPPESRRCYTR